MKIGIIGYGHAGRLYTAALEELGQEIVHVADPSRARLAEAAARLPHAAAAASLQAPTRDPALDAVVIATPLETRFSLAYEALKLGKHVLVDGPLAASAQEARCLAELAQRSGRVLHVGHPGLHGQAARRAKDLIEEPESGALLTLDVERSRRGAARRVPDLLYGLAARDVALLCFLLGRPPQWASASATTSGVTDQVDRLSLSLGFADGPAARIEIAALGATGRLRAVAQRRALVVEEASPVKTVLWVDAGGCAAARESSPPEFPGEASFGRREVCFEDPLLRLCEHFAGAAQHGGPVPADLEAAVGVVAALEAASRSLAGSDPAPRDLDLP